MSHHPANTIGALCGSMAFITKKSKPSLIAGVGSAILFFTAGYLIKENQNYGHELAFISSALLTGGMGRRALITQKPIPSAVALLGLTGGIYYAYKMYEYW